MMDKIWQQYQRARKFYEEGEYVLALEHSAGLYEKAQAEAWAWQAAELLGFSWYMAGDVKKSVHYLWQAVVRCPAGVDQQRLFSNYLMFLHYLPGVSDDFLRQQHFAYGRLFAGCQQFSHVPREHQKLRIGYLSPNFCTHIVVNFAIQLLACHNRERFEVYCYSLNPEENETTAQLRSLIDGWMSLAGMDALAAAQSIYSDGIDILVDLAGHTEGGVTLRIAAYKPAPVQVSGIGYFDTTGLPAMDYFLSDVYCDPPENDRLFQEQLLRLPHSHFCYTPPETAAIEPHYRLHHPVVFGSFNNFTKITDEMLQLWKQLLDRLPGSRLLLKNVQNNRRQERLLGQRARRLGFSADDLEIRTASRDYLREYMDMDVALDTYPYPGGGTTCEALYMGVPVISLYSQRHGSRFGYSLLHNLGLGELAAGSLEDYLDRAAAIAADPELLRGLHGMLRSRMQQSPLMDGASYTREAEAAYEKIWQLWRRRCMPGT